MAGAVLSGLGLVADVAGVIFVAVAQHRLLAVLGNWLDRKSPTSNVSNIPIIQPGDRLDLAWPGPLEHRRMVVGGVGFMFQLVGIIAAACGR